MSVFQNKRLGQVWVLKMPSQQQPIEKIRNEEHHIPKKLRTNKQSVFSVYIVSKIALNLILILYLSGLEKMAGLCNM